MIHDTMNITHKYAMREKGGRSLAHVTGLDRQVGGAINKTKNKKLN